MKFASICVGAIALALMTAGARAQDSEGQRVSYNIQSQPFIQALKAFGEQSNLQLLLSSSDVSAAGMVSPEIKGELTPEQALTKLLAETNLRYQFVNSRTVAISRDKLRTQRPAQHVTFMRTSMAFDPEPSGAANEATARLVSDASVAPTADDGSEEVVVTGTHIRDTEPVSPVLVYSKDDIDKTGAATVHEFLATLPQNFGGSQSADTSGDAIEGLPFDPGMGSSINLRGLGSASTLVLVDGRRTAAAGRGDYTDVSMIPLAAVERIEVVTDGASALYGSDAVGGVVNFIMRKDFSGAETRLRYGDTTEGGLAQRQASQVVGTHWDTGSTVLSYEYLNQSELSRADRDFSANAPGTNNGPKSLVPSEKRHSVSAFGKQEIGSRVTASANGMYSERDGEAWTFEGGTVQTTDVTRKQYGGGVGLQVDLGGSWSAQLDGSYNKGTVLRTTIQNPLTGADFVWDSTYDLWATDLLVSGDLVPLPWGAIKLAAGAGYREEALDYKTSRNGVVGSVLNTETLQVQAAYAELSMPIGDRGDRPRAPLMLSAAGRYEDYSTFGDTLDPTYGVRWTPLKALSLYATYGTSFKAPNLFQFQQNPFFNSNVIGNVRLPTGTVRILNLSGNSDDLKEQTADTFTAGVEFTVPVGSGLLARLNYFSIDYSDRIQGVDANPLTVMTTPAYRSLVTLRGDMSDAEFNALIAQNLSGANARVVSCTVPLSGVGCATPPGSFAAIVDRRLQNFASVEVNGLDLTLSQDLVLGQHRLGLDLNASYFLDFDQQLNPASSTQSILNTLYNPVDLKVRGSASWSHERWTSTFSVSHTAGYSTRGALLRSNDAPMPEASVDSWTTFDLVLGYTVAEETGSFWLDGLSMALSVSNLFDKDPPYVDDQYYGFGYDPANADPRGRMISLTVGRRW